MGRLRVAYRAVFGHANCTRLVVVGRGTIPPGGWWQHRLPCFAAIREGVIGVR